MGGVQGAEEDVEKEDSEDNDDTLDIEDVLATQPPSDLAEVSPSPVIECVAIMNSGSLPEELLLNFFVLVFTGIYLSGASRNL
jgi:hypothetical protein